MKTKFCVRECSTQILVCQTHKFSIRFSSWILEFMLNFSIMPSAYHSIAICIWKLCLHMCQDSQNAVSKCWNDSGKWQKWKIDLNFPSVCVTAIDCSLWKSFNAKLSSNVSCEIGRNNFKQFLTQILLLYSIFVNIILSKSSRIICKLVSKNVWLIIKNSLN